MTLKRILLCAGIVPCLVFSAASMLRPRAINGGYILERDSEVQSTEAGPHSARGQTTAYSFFKKVPGLTLVFGKRASRPGSVIGYHRKTEDKIYYVLSGRGAMTIDGKTFDLGPGETLS